MKNNIWILPAIAFLVALMGGSFIFGAITNLVGPQVAPLTTGIVGFIVGGLFIFGVYVLIMRHVKGTEPPT